MKTFLSFVKKETLHIVRDFRTMLIVLVVPVVLMLLFGFAISTEVNEVTFMVVSPKKSPAERLIINKLSQNELFQFKGYISEKEIDKVLRSSKAMAVICFAPTYENDLYLRSLSINTPELIQIITDASNTNTAAMVATYLQTALGAQGQNSAALFNTHLRHNPQMKSSYNFVPGVMGLIFILICAMMTSVSIVREKEYGTMEVLLVSPVKPLTIVFAKMAPYFVLSCINLTTILLISYYIMDVPMQGGVVNIVLFSVLYLMLALFLGLFVSTIAKTQLTALLFSAVIMLVPMMMLSGMMYPIENLPIILKQLTAIVPARWYINAIKKLMIAGVEFKYVLQEFFILLGMTVFFIVLSLKKFNNKLE